MKIEPNSGFVPTNKLPEKANSQTTLEKAAEGFETLLTHQIVQELQKDLEGQSMFGGGVEGNTIGAMAEWELATHLARSLDFGVLKQLELSAGAEKGDK